MRSTIVKMFGIFAGAVLVAVGYAWVPVVPLVQPLDQNAPQAVAFFDEFMAHRNPDQSLKYVPDDKVILADGTETGLRSLVRGKWAVLNLWATWCAPCIEELPSLAALQTKYKGRINVLALSFDNNTNVQNLSKFMAKHNAEGLPFAYDGLLKVRTTIPTQGLPTSLIIDPNGEVIVVLEGHTNWVSDKALAFFESILTKS